MLGAPGIGKSTICLAALHDARVAERFGARRWFVRCDGAQSAQDVLSGLAAEMGVTGGGAPGGSVAGRVRAALGAGPAVVVLDNFETPWAADPLPVEELLRAVASVPRVGVAVTSRGTGRPAGLRWRDFAMVSPLPLADARRLFLAVAGPDVAADPRLDGLLAELDGVPLAVELMAYAAQGQADLGEVAERWRAERTGMLARMGGERRELSVAVSVEASVTAPLMTPAGRRLLSLLGVLPDGMARQDLTALLPGGGLAAAAVLRQLGLAFGEGDRLRTLAPVREHVAAAHPPEAADLDRAIGHYARLAATTGNRVGRSGGAEAAARLQADTGNIAAMLERAAAGGRIQELADAVYGLAEYWRFTGFTQPALAVLAGQAIEAHGTPVQQARTWKALGTLAADRSDHDGARARFEEALPLYRQAGSVVGEANCIHGLGDIALARSDHDGARARYEQALPLYRQAGDVLGEANCIKSLGDIALDRSDHDGARARYERGAAAVPAGPVCARRGQLHPEPGRHRAGAGPIMTAPGPGSSRRCRCTGRPGPCSARPTASRAWATSRWPGPIMTARGPGMRRRCRCTGRSGTCLARPTASRAWATSRWPGLIMTAPGPGMSRRCRCTGRSGPCSARPTASGAWATSRWRGLIMTAPGPGLRRRCRCTGQFRSLTPSAGRWSA